jgi:uncharacterized spore protein YtfJ
MPRLSGKFITSESESYSIGSRTITPVSQALVIQARYWGLVHGGIMWNRPAGVVIQDEDGSRSFKTVIDVTRLAQIGILLAGFLGVLMIRRYYRTRNKWGGNTMTEETTTMSGQENNVEKFPHAEVVERTMEEFLSKADVKVVYGTPIKKDDALIIPAAEVLATLGFGAGEGKGPKDEGGGSGSGGGGRAFSRPVAVVVASPQGVRVEPVIDLTKIGLAALTTAGFMLATLLRMRSPRQMEE